MAGFEVSILWPVLGVHRGPGISGIAVGEGAVWAASNRGVSRIDPRTGQVAASIRIGSPVYGTSTVVVAEGMVWAVSNEDNSLWRIDPKTNQTVGKPVLVEGGATFLAVGDGVVWVANFAGGTISRIGP